jgi:hypothetical protein
MIDGNRGEAGDVDEEAETCLAMGGGSRSPKVGQSSGRVGRRGDVPATAEQRRGEEVAVRRSNGAHQVGAG